MEKWVCCRCKTENEHSHWAMATCRKCGLDMESSVESEEMEDGWVCGQCLTENEPDAKKCKECGAQDLI